jgi:frataxin
MARIDESSFARLADATLAGLLDMLEGLLDERADVDLQNGILTIDLENVGRYVINKHAPNRQLWMSSPVGGATHFDWDEANGWTNTRGVGTLRSILERELSTATGLSVVLDRPPR